MKWNVVRPVHRDLYMIGGLTVIQNIKKGHGKKKGKEKMSK